TAVAPIPGSIAEFSIGLGNALSRTAVMPLPAFVLKVLTGEMSDLLTTGQFVLPTKAQKHNYRLHYQTDKSPLDKYLKLVIIIINHNSVK
ncbi:hypothetical protein CWB63_18485, partial [Pseudoalteromonas sp. S409]|uniref:DUF1731 domain-containing protein n=1 Tax=Pseudoalteromonas sp. S409 TaxID=2066518 RepID=UPI001109CE02